MDKSRFLRLFITLMAVIALAFPTARPVQAQPPANDNFADAMVVTSLPFYTGQVEISSATTEIGEPMPACAYYPGRTFWLAYTPAVTEYVTAYSTSSETFWVMYTGGPTFDSLTQLNCQSYGGRADFQLQAGTTYFFQVGSIWGNSNWADFALDYIPPPANDNFADAMLVTTLPFDQYEDLTGATTEPGEPMSSCAFANSGWTGWFAFTPSVSGSYTFSGSSGTYNMWPFMALWTGPSLTDLSEVACASYGGSITKNLEQGMTYYIQLGSMYDGGGAIYFNVHETPLPSPSFYYSPWDPSVYDTVTFMNQSYDPAGIGISMCAFNFGDGTTAESCYPTHRYAKDGDYTVTLQVQTVDGRSATIMQTVPVRTHDVGIIRFTVPKSASAGQTRPITVSIKNTRYSETVMVDLFKSTPGGYMFLGTLTMAVPVRAGNRSTDFQFSYTFTKDDASIGKVTFRAIATLQGARDALPADNEMISLAVKVSK